MRNTLDVFKAQQQAVEELYSRLTEVAALVCDLKKQVDALRVTEDLKQTLEVETAWLARLNDLLRDVQFWRERELRQMRRTILWRWTLVVTFALVASAASGAGFLWAWDPYASELASLRSEVKFAHFMEMRVAEMTAAERLEFDRLIKPPQSRRR
jgi:hypothetical protein